MSTDSRIRVIGSTSSEEKWGNALFVGGRFLPLEGVPAPKIFLVPGSNVEVVMKNVVGHE